jgi:hypothetical protein
MHPTVTYATWFNHWSLALWALETTTPRLVCNGDDYYDSILALARSDDAIPVLDWLARHVRGYLRPYRHLRALLMPAVHTARVLDWIHHRCLLPTANDPFGRALMARSAAHHGAIEALEWMRTHWRIERDDEGILRTVQLSALSCPTTAVFEWLHAHGLLDRDEVAEHAVLMSAHPWQHMAWLLRLAPIDDYGMAERLIKAFIVAPEQEGLALAELTRVQCPHRVLPIFTVVELAWELMPPTLVSAARLDWLWLHHASLLRSSWYCLLRQALRQHSFAGLEWMHATLPDETMALLCDELRHPACARDLQTMDMALQGHAAAYAQLRGAMRASDNSVVQQWLADNVVYL